MNKIFERRSCRSFKDIEVKIEDIKEMIYAAMQAPSAMRQIPWDFVVVDRTEIPTLMNCSHGAGSLRECNKVVIFVMRNDLRCPEFLEQDMSSAIDNFMLQGRDLGLATIWIGTYPHKERVDFLKNYLKIDDPFIPFAMVGVGYPKDENLFKFDESRFDEERIHIGKW
ncbi:MAG: nitroreductase family protein [Acholeplasmatales bacterium]|nr:nitroreductase family protein [Acholeplasmatales bacterium]